MRIAQEECLNIFAKQLLTIQTEAFAFSSCHTFAIFIPQFMMVP